jgi:hypothetical protein
MWDSLVPPKGQRPPDVLYETILILIGSQPTLLHPLPSSRPLSYGRR